MASDGSYLITVTNSFLRITMKFLRERQHRKDPATVTINCMAMTTSLKDLREWLTHSELHSVQIIETHYVLTGQYREKKNNPDNELQAQDLVKLL